MRSLQMDGIMPSSSPELNHRLMQAGAGAGKTTTLIATFLAYVQDFRKRNEGAFPRIVITTFTRKATQEVKERLLRKALEEGDDDVFRYLSQRSRVHISTIHGVLSVFLARYGDRIGLSSDFKIAASEELTWLGRRELRRLLAQTEDSLALLEDQTFTELWNALEQWRETAGSDDRARFANSDDFRRETRDRVRELVDEAQALAAEIPGASKNERWLEWAEVLATIKMPGSTDDDLEKFLGRLCELDELMGRKPASAAGKTKLVDPVTNDRFKAFIANRWEPLTESDKGVRYRPSFWRRHDERCALFERLGRAYKERLDRLLIERGLVSMADLETRSLEVIRRDPSAAAAFAAEWDYWMIDEYQDTSPVQVELLKALVGDKPHFVVGDPQQSIYSFRGARSEVFFEKMKEFSDAGALVQDVAVNYRSRAPLLEFFNDFFGPNPAFRPMDPKSSKLPQSDLPVAELRPVDPLENGDACVLAVIERVQELLRAGAAPESICILARKNDHLKDILNEARRRRLPMQLHTAAGFSRRREVRDARAFLTFLLNPADNLNLLTLLRSPWFQLPDDDLVKVCESRPVSIWSQALTVSADAADDHPVKRLSGWLDESGRCGLAGALRGFYRREGVLDSAALADPSGRREANLWKLLTQLENAQRQPGFNGLAFTRGLDRSLATEEGAEDGDAVPAVEPKRVNLMTVHASKGLEFDHVLITHLESRRKTEVTEFFQYDEDSRRWTIAEKTLAGSRIGSLLSASLIAALNQRQAEESVRVLYVAFTRAMQTVTLVWEKSAREDARSWVSLIPFPREEGLHVGEKYTYRVRCEPPAPGEEAADSAPHVIPRTRWTTEWPDSNNTVSVTSLLEKRGSSKAASGEISPQAAAKGLRFAQRGTDAHRLFEALRTASLDHVRAMTKDESLRAAVEWIAGREDPPYMDIIRRGHAEWGFAVKGDRFVLQGQIDLWGEVDGTVWLVDYKTGSPEYAEKALDQLAIYAWALLKLKRLRPDQPLKLVAVYPLDQKTEIRSFGRADELGPQWERVFKP